LTSEQGWRRHLVECQDAVKRSVVTVATKALAYNNGQEQPSATNCGCENNEPKAKAGLLPASQVLKGAEWQGKRRKGAKRPS